MNTNQTPEQRSLVGRLIRFCLENRLIVVLFTVAVIFAGVLVAPFDWKVGELQRYPVSVDAIPDIGENQQIVFTEWMGRSPQDVEDQIGYPLTVQLLGIPGVKTIRSYSMFGFSSIYIIFEENVEFYWSRTRVLEKLNSLSAGTLPEGVQPTLGPDATALGQVYWYTLEGLDPDGNPTGGWDPEELRTVQDWYARYWLLSADGVAEVASIGGYVREYQIDVDPDAMRAFGVSIDEVYGAVKGANIDVGAKSIEVNRVEYFIRGIGFIKSIADIENSVIKVGAENVPVLVKHVAGVTLGPATRRGALDKGGAPAVGGVVVARYGDNPLRVISNVKDKIAETKDALPAKAIIDFNTASPEAITAFALNEGFDAYADGSINQESWKEYLRSSDPVSWPEWVTLSKVSIVPFYDRTGLIYETLGTLNEAIGQEILITIIVVLIMVMHLRSGLVISSMLPLAVLLCFVGMKLFNVQANIVALSGIVIAIGTIVDMGIVICENILRHLDASEPGADHFTTEDTEDTEGHGEEPLCTQAKRVVKNRESKLEVVHRAASEVGSAVLTAVMTTIVSFLPVFTMIGAEGKLFKPLAFTKTFALLASILLALTLLPVLAHAFFGKGKARKVGRDRRARRTHAEPEATGSRSFGRTARRAIPTLTKFLPIILTVLLVGYWLTIEWEPLGPERGTLRNLLFVALLIGGLLGFFKVFQHFYPRILAWCLKHKAAFLMVPLALLILGMTSWLGFNKTFGWLPNAIKQTAPIQKIAHTFPGFGKEFMPALDEGSFLFMPTTMTHASIGETIDILEKQDMAIGSIPEIESVVGKLGRAETPLDPAPISMIETVINYIPEYKSDKDGRRINYKYKNGSAPEPIIAADVNGTPPVNILDILHLINFLYKDGTDPICE